MNKFIPAPGMVEIKPLKQEGLAPISEEKYEEMGEVISCGDGVVNIQTGDTIFFDSYACRATPEIEGQKHYFVNVIDGGLLAIVKNDVAAE